MTWILLVLLYGVLKGAREVIKKKSLQGSTVMEVLVVYTVLAFLMVLPDYKNAMNVDPKFLFWIALKSFIIFISASLFQNFSTVLVVNPASNEDMYLLLPLLK